LLQIVYTRNNKNRAAALLREDDLAAAKRGVKGGVGAIGVESRYQAAVKALQK